MINLFPGFINPDSGTGTSTPIGGIVAIENNENSGSVRTKLNSAINGVNQVPAQITSTRNRINHTGELADLSLASSVFVPVSATTITLSSTVHRGKVVYFTSASAVTVTLPSGLPAGYTCELVQAGAGLVTVVVGSSGLTYIGPNTNTLEKGRGLLLSVLTGNLVYNRRIGA